MKIVIGNLLTCDASVICQQNNCWTRKPHGLSKLIQNKYPHCELYSSRSGKTPNIASTPDTPGKCKIYKGSPTIACILGQWRPGKPGKWNSVYKEHSELKDTYEQRETWFGEALADLATQLKEEKETVAFPYKIGCGLAGGNWEKYRAMIEKFDEDNDHIEVWCVVLPRFAHEVRTGKRKDAS